MTFALATRPGIASLTANPMIAIRSHGLSLAGMLCLLTWSALFGTANAANPDDVRKRFIEGAYEEVIEAANKGIKENPREPEWPLLLGEAQWALGRYADARVTFDRGVAKNPFNLQIRLAALKATREGGNKDRAQKYRDELERLASTRAWDYRTPADRVALGRVAILLGLDPQAVFDQYFDAVRKAQPDFRDSYLAAAELALSKHDYALAAKNLNAAAKKIPNDPEILLALARAYAPSDSEAAGDAVEKALALNPRLVDAWLLLADHHIDSENYAAATKALDEALKVNPHRPEAHAYRAVLAHLRADLPAEATAKQAALQPWQANPQVPHLIGRKLSQKYRFAEGAALQRDALKVSPDFLAAKSQLANDLLRLGQDDEGWKLAEEVQKADPYDVVAYNLTTLREVLSKFRTLNSDHFIVRMDPHEADVYGAQVTALLERAHQTLTQKYGLELKEKTIVEIFPDQKDFAIRTFGLPGGSGYLGVCFGRLITANSPAARPGSANSWEAVLWHEFCHVVTLTKTGNKMPRWLSEGISVYEERQARGNWGERMKPRYRAMILSEDLTPISKLSGAFLNPKTPIHLGFAYYESSLVVEWLLERWGMDKMKELLSDLATGREMNAALAARYAPIEQLDTEFAAHAQALANGSAPKLDWTIPKPAQLANERATSEFLASNPDNAAALQEQALGLLQKKDWAAAKVPLQKLIELNPEQHEAEGAYALLARAQQGLGETESETATLEKLASLSSDAPDAYERLMQLAVGRKDWPAVLTNADRFLGVNPVSPIPYRYLAEAREAQGDRNAAITSYRTLLGLNPADPSEIHYRLARLLHANGAPEAKQHLLLALEETPRFRAALELLLEISGQPSSASRVESPKTE